MGLTWIDKISKQPKTYLGKFIIHDNEDVYFASNNILEANE